LNIFDSFEIVTQLTIFDSFELVTHLTIIDNIEIVTGAQLTIFEEFFRL
jgi:hypothetical protein